MFDDILDKIGHKDSVKSTTTLKFKRDLIKILMHDLDGDILEVGASGGNTTAILSAIAAEKGFTVHAFDNNHRSLEVADELLRGLNLKNYKLYCKDVYKEDWSMNRMGCVFIDCIHAAENFAIDMINTEKITDDNSIIIAHDYGLITTNGDSIKPVFDNPKYEIISYLGEKDEWNELGSGKVIDWEGVQIKIRSLL